MTARSTPDQRARALEAYRAGATLDEAGALVGVSKTAVASWIVKAGGETANRGPRVELHAGGRWVGHAGRQVFVPFGHPDPRRRS